MDCSDADWTAWATTRSAWPEDAAAPPWRLSLDAEAVAAVAAANVEAQPGTALVA